MSGCPAHLAAGEMVDRRDTPFRNAIWRFAMRGHVGAGAPRPKGRICLGYSPALYRHRGIGHNNATGQAACEAALRSAWRKVVDSLVRIRTA
jgi:hypothetical protein